MSVREMVSGQIALKPFFESYLRNMQLIDGYLILLY